MPKAIIHSTKYNGSQHYHFESEIISITDREFRFYNRPGDPFDCYRGKLVSKSHSLRIFYPDRPWNVMVRWYPDWRFEEFYVNIASLPTWDGLALNWVDLDLDIIFSAGKNEPMLDDAEEFEIHKKKWNYPETLVAQCWRSVEEVWGMMKSQAHPFDLVTTSWRP